MATESCRRLPYLLVVNMFASELNTVLSDQDVLFISSVKKVKYFVAFDLIDQMPASLNDSHGDQADGD